MTSRAFRLAALALAALGGCSLELRDNTGECASRPELCLPCSEDADCVIAGNECNGWLACMHRDTDVAFTQQGCVEWRSRPDDGECRCADSVCRVR